MALPWLDPFVLGLVDTWYALVPRLRPDPALLRQTRILSHRGERDAAGVIENSFAAFDPLPGRVFGLECDVRFSRDGVPMVFHDADLYRIFNCRERLCDLDSHSLRQRFPQIPSLRELVERYGGQLHLAIEFKQETRPDPAAQLHAVRAALAPLSPARDFHLMSLDCATLDWLRPAFPDCLVAIARGNVSEMGEYAQACNCAGMTGHYALLHRARNIPHLQQGRWVGIGFPESRNALRYALHQGATWLFSNQALALQAMLEREKSRSIA